MSGILGLALVAVALVTAILVVRGSRKEMQTEDVLAKEEREAIPKEYWVQQTGGTECKKNEEEEGATYCQFCSRRSMCSMTLTDTRHCHVFEGGNKLRGHQGKAMLSLCNWCAMRYRWSDNLPDEGQMRFFRKSLAVLVFSLFYGEVSMLEATVEKGREEQVGVAGGGNVFVPDVPMDQIRPGRFQARKHFGKEMKDLEESIRALGVIEPIIVRNAPDGGYEIIAGERRWRAAKAVGLTSIPAVISDADDREARLMTLTENMLREDLTLMEEAAALQGLINDRVVKSQRDLAKMLHVSPGLISQIMAIWRLPAEIRDDMASQSDEHISRRHVRELVRLPDVESQKKMYQRFKECSLTAEQLGIEVDKVLGKRTTDGDGGEGDGNGRVPDADGSGDAAGESTPEPKERETGPTLVIEFAGGKIIGLDGHAVFEASSREIAKKVLGILMQVIEASDAGVRWNGEPCEASKKTVTVHETEYDVDAICNLLIGAEKTEGSR